MNNMIIIIMSCLSFVSTIFWMKDNRKPVWGRHPTIETNEFSWNNNNIGEGTTWRPHSMKLTPKGY